MATRTTITINGETYALDDDFLSHVLETAVEGACSYWADVNADSIGDDAGIEGARDFDVGDYVEDPESGGGGERFATSASFLVSGDASQGGTLDLQGMADAIERIAHGDVDVPPAIRAIILAAVQEGDPADIDGEAADCIVQIGLFDEIVYG
jgi:hypothetical protein